MERFFKIAGRLTGKLVGKAARSRIFDKTISTAFSYAVSEMKLTDLRARKAFLRRKKKAHLYHLGRVSYRLHTNRMDIFANPNINLDIKVIGEIESEIACVDEEIKRRKETYRKKPPADTVEF